VFASEYRFLREAVPCAEGTHVIMMAHVWMLNAQLLQLLEQLCRMPQS
jgi:hypothetical protein